jgi:hypothetical protein
MARRCVSCLSFHDTPLMMFAVLPLGCCAVPLVFIIYLQFMAVFYDVEKKNILSRGYGVKMTVAVEDARTRPGDNKAHGPQVPDARGTRCTACSPPCSRAYHLSIPKLALFIIRWPGHAFLWNLAQMGCPLVGERLPQRLCHAPLLSHRPASSSSYTMISRPGRPRSASSCYFARL